MTTLAARMPDELIARVDELVGSGAYPNRTAAVRAALERLVEAEHRAAIDRAIVEGYRRIPADPPTALETEMGDALINAEPW